MYATIMTNPAHLAFFSQVHPSNYTEGRQKLSLRINLVSDKSFKKLCSTE
ncbi:hypothetical protein AtNW77_Chr1g0037301 [Arabidopsis thaliana]|uniref:(thale cress) hypothetical protein n=1 Tax=Arabidopsis thaliana TaxID=3702 RepID=A0A7G2E0Y3_ARATH|nr:unnamed protein product [Arabidopsis thaliana]